MDNGGVGAASVALGVGSGGGKMGGCVTIIFVVLDVYTCCCCG